MTRRVDGMLKIMEANADLVSAGLTFLELSSIEASSLRQYVQALGLFSDWRSTWTSADVSGASLDVELTTWIDGQFALGHKPWRGEKLVTALMTLAPSCSTAGDIGLPRTFRVVKGCRKRCPPTSEKPMSWPVWASLVMEMLRAGERRAAVGALLMVACYLRPCELVQLNCDRLLGPTAHGVGSWSPLLHPSEEAKASKTGERDETCPVDKPELSFLAPVLKSLSERPVGEQRLGMSYLEYLKVFSKAARRLGLPLLPSLGSHSGANIDAALSRRTLLEIQRMGRWKSVRPVRRYEKMRRLNATLKSMTTAQQCRAEVCAANLVYHELD